MEHLVVNCEEKKAGVGSFRSVGEPGQQRPGGSVYRWWVGSNFIGGGTGAKQAKCAMRCQIQDHP